MTFTVDRAPPVLAVSPSSLSFAATAGGSSPAAKTLAVSNTGGGTLSWTASETPRGWRSRRDGTTGTITVTPTLGALTAGTYTTDVTVTSSARLPKTVAVTFMVDSAPAELSVSPSTLAFAATQGGSSPAAKTLEVSNAGGGALTWSASDDAPWLTVSTAAQRRSRSRRPSVRSPGTYTTDVVVTAAAAARRRSR